MSKHEHEHDIGLLAAFVILIAVWYLGVQITDAAKIMAGANQPEVAGEQPTEGSDR